MTNTNTRPLGIFTVESTAVSNLWILWGYLNQIEIALPENLLQWRYAKTCARSTGDKIKKVKSNTSVVLITGGLGTPAISIVEPSAIVMSRDSAAINTSREIDKVAISASNDCNTPAHI